MTLKEFNELESMYAHLHSVCVCGANYLVCRYDDTIPIDEDGNTECAAIKELFERYTGSI